jgi:hypothetical protein
VATGDWIAIVGTGGSDTNRAPPDAPQAASSSRAPAHMRVPTTALVGLVLLFNLLPLLPVPRRLAGEVVIDPKRVGIPAHNYPSCAHLGVTRLPASRPDSAICAPDPGSVCSPR